MDRHSQHSGDCCRHTADGLIGLLVGSRGVGGPIGFFIAMFAGRMDGRLSMAIGFGLLTIASYWMMHFNLETTAYEMALDGVVQGRSIGLIFAPLNVLAFADLAPKYRPETIAVFHLLRNIGSSLFISYCLAEVTRPTGVNYARPIEFINPSHPGISSPWVIGSWNADTFSGTAALSGEVTRQSAMVGYINVFGVMARACVARWGRRPLCDLRASREAPGRGRGLVVESDWMRHTLVPAFYSAAG